MTKTNKTPDEEPEETSSEGATPTEEAAPSKRTYFLPFEGRIIEAEDLADVETQLNKEKELEVGDGNS